MNITKVITLCLFLCSTQLKGKDTVKYNVLMIIVDDLSSLVQQMDNKDLHIPHLRKLMESGRSFERAYCQAPLCNPSRTSFMTGRRPNETHIYTNDPHFRGVNKRLKTIPQHFKEQGYFTAGIGKIFHNWGQAIQGDPISWTEEEMYHWGTHSSDWYIPNRPYQMHIDIPKGPAVQCVDVVDEAYVDGRIAQAAVQKLTAWSEVPFFMAIGFWKPHLPFNAPKKYWDLYDRNQLPKLKYTEPVVDVPEIAYVDSDEARSYSDVNRHQLVPIKQKAELRHGYCAAISYLDAQIGKVLDQLEKLQLSEKTHVVFVSDHGYHAGEHGQFGKWTNFEIGTRVPLIIASPEVKNPGEPSFQVVELIDLFPTLTDLCNLPAPKLRVNLQGKSLVPYLQDSEVKGNTYAVTEIARPIGGEATFKSIGSSIRSNTHRYTFWRDRFSGEILEEEFYDLQSDPFEVVNIAQSEKDQAIKMKLQNKLLQIIECK
ncbi:sulfatase [Membranihabitans maritimus]|uniref:sulfatase n=1 Tax=Membranihabitans maritimus TaxID=2904244 RepID=UPI001F2F35C1|nr:sulfatase [Membranihabitans maritimus]